MSEVRVDKSVRSLEPSVVDDHWVRVGDFTLDMQDRTVATRRGSPAKLSTNEFAILTRLCETPGRPVAREHLFQVLAIGNADPEIRVVDAFIGHVRRLLMDARSAATIERTSADEFTLWP